MTIRIEVRDEEHWKTLRRGCVITASNIPALLCDDFPYATPYRLFLEATGRVQPRELTGSVLDAGNDAELMMPSRVERRRPGLSIVKNRDFFIHEYMPVGGTPDFFDQNGGVWEGKCVDPDIYRARWSFGPPLWVKVQLHANYILSSGETGGIISLQRDRGFTTELWDTPRESYLSNHIEYEVSRFCHAVKHDTWDRPIDYDREASAIIELNTDTEPGTLVNLTDDTVLYDLACEYLSYKAQEKQIETYLDSLKARIFTTMATTERAICGDIYIATKTTAKKGQRPYRTLKVKRRD